MYPKSILNDFYNNGNFKIDVLKVNDKDGTFLYHVVSIEDIDTGYKVELSGKSQYELKFQCLNELYEQKQSLQKGDLVSPKVIRTKNNDDEIMAIVDEIFDKYDNVFRKLRDL